MDPAVTASLTDISETSAVIDAMMRSLPDASTLLSPLIDLHRSHEALLRSLAPQAEVALAPPTPPLITTNRRLHAELNVLESELADALALHASSATAGPVARAIASMAAATAQRAYFLVPAGRRTDQTAIQVPALAASEVGSSEVAAVQRILTNEHADVWWYGVLGGRVSASKSPRLFNAIKAGYELHRHNRDDLTSALVAAGATPVAAEATYPLPWPASSPKEIAAAGDATERSAATAYSWLVANTSGTTRSWAIRALRTAAVRGLVLQGTPENFPGADELTDR